MNEGRPYRLLLADRLDRTLRLCQVCGVLSLDNNAECLVCGGATVAMEAGEALARAAASLAARTDIIGGGLLDRHGGAAALLRF